MICKKQNHYKANGESERGVILRNYWKIINSTFIFKISLIFTN